MPPANPSTAPAVTYISRGSDLSATPIMQPSAPPMQAVAPPSATPRNAPAQMLPPAFWAANSPASAPPNAPRATPTTKPELMKADVNAASPKRVAPPVKIAPTTQAAARRAIPMISSTDQKLQPVGSTRETGLPRQKR